MGYTAPEDSKGDIVVTAIVVDPQFYCLYTNATLLEQYSRDQRRILLRKIEYLRSQLISSFGIDATALSVADMCAVVTNSCPDTVRGHSANSDEEEFSLLVESVDG